MNQLLSAETFLLEFFQANPSPSQVTQTALDQESNWPVYYHLAPQRQNLLDWYDFSQDNTLSQPTLLEIGAGCGALTGLFLDRGLRVTALEPDPTRYPVLTTRHQNSHFHARQLTLRDFTVQNSQPQFHYVTLIGVLEYASQFYAEPNPYLQLLRDLTTQLLPGGHLLLAIENRLGLKYWNGCTEDHTGEYFSSLENYPRTNQIQTFTRSEISELLHQAGFKKLDFYYPFPDYKLPQLVLHESQLANSAQLPTTLTELSADGWQTSEKLTPFHAGATTFFLQKEQLLPQFANSFLIDATV